ncbi:hypothetical protein FHS43_005736 [Streptosporangium becharense]|uniref:DUF2975 domain-containing protein n=1 Tax=Streptosporangium becharense TaxID=1816182 RepID=A0A7W9MKI1_9ACTN|nr:DUF2975 domain-containing protein [Streptosporangium becharense]MBB2914424.1 hypothetical protein [Streptosporangium becharense]MBB5823544.1 hypothetical protein [Streptosporangium becharense]
MRRARLRAWAVRTWWAVFENLVYLAFALAVVALLATVWMAVAGSAVPVTMEVPQAQTWPDTIPRQVGPLRISPLHSAAISLDRPGRWQALALNAPSAVTASLTVVITFLLWRVARTLRSGDPFVPRNARRIFVMAGCMAGYGLLVEPLRTVTAVVMVEGTAAEGLIDADWPFNPVPVGFALLLVALGAVFREGARMREDAGKLL